jgi:IS5 family transposase
MPRLSRQKKGERISRAGKIKGSKISLVVDEGGLPEAINLDAAGRNDRYAFGNIVEQIPKDAYLAADKGYDCKKLRRRLRHKGLRPLIPRRQFENKVARRTPKPYLYRSRWTIERCFAWLGKFRKLEIRYEYHWENWYAFWQLGCAMLCLQKVTV